MSRVAGQLLIVSLSLLAIGFLVPAEPAQERGAAEAVGKSTDQGAEDRSRPRVAGEQLSSGQSAWERAKASLEALGRQLDSYIGPVKEQVAPLTDRLPGPLQTFLDRGGWWLVLAIVLWVVASWLRSLCRRVIRVASHAPRRSRPRSHKRDWTLDLREDLAPLGTTYTAPAGHVLTVQGVPARLRLLVMATRDARPLDEEMAHRVLDCIQRGMGEVVGGDYPRIRVWPRKVAGSSFPQYFERFVSPPGSASRRSHWALLTGTVLCGRQEVNVGLALYTDERNHIRSVRVPAGRWRDYLGLANAMGGWA
jgi:hypothetical protein